MAQLRSNWRQLTLVRLIRGFFAMLVALGRWEYKLLIKEKAPRRRHSFSWLIGLGYSVERLVVALWRLSAGVAIAGVVIIKIIWWPLAVIIKLFGQIFKVKYKTIQPAVWQEITQSPAKAAKHLKIKPHLAFFKPVAAFACLLALIILPLKFYGNFQALINIKNQVMLTAKAAINDTFSAKQAVEQKDFAAANRRFSDASANFMAADAEMQKVNGFLLTLASLLPNAQAKLAGSSEAILQAGNLGTGIASDLSLAMDGLFGQNKDKDIVSALTSFTEHGGAAKDKADQLSAVLAKIDEDALPDQYRGDFAYFKDRVKFMSASLGELVDMSAKLRVFLGETYDKRYLLIFQNNTEARATGGFMGSFAVVDFSRGRIKNLSVPGGGVYDTEAGMRQVIPAPEPLQLIKSRWYMWDANWWPDWPTSARKIMSFYEQSDGSTVDGVISLTPDVIINLLKITGPIELTGNYNLTITADNFMPVVQAIAEQKNGPTNTPKKIIGDLTEKLMAKISAEHDQNQWLKIIGVMEESLNSKQILLYFTDNDLAAKVADLGWDGQLKSTNGDYLSIINTNIGGAKSDGVIKQTVEVTTNILSDGSLVDNVKIIRDHQGVKGAEFSGVKNRDWLRIYVPLGSKLLEADGFKSPDAALFQPADPSWTPDADLANENSAAIDTPSGTKIYREQDKTVFANWSMVDPGEATVIKLSYKLPFKLEARPNTQSWLDRVRDVFAQNNPANLYRYSLLVQKQAGATNSEINYKLALPSNYDQVWQYPENSSPADYLPQDTDKYFGYILKDKK